MSDPAVLDSLAAYHHVVATRCLTFTGFTMLVYDHIITFSDEVAQVWARPKNVVSLMFLFNRYLMPLLLIVDLYEKSGIGLRLTRSFCATWLLFEGYIVILVFSIIHALASMRVCALYGQSKCILVLLWVSLLVYVTSMFTLVTIGLVPMAQRIRPALSFDICFTTLSKDLWTIWLPSLVFESLIFALTLARVVQCRTSHEVHMPIADLMYRDGIFYFLAMCTISLLCLFDWLMAPATLSGLVKYFGYAADVWTVSHDFLDFESNHASIFTQLTQLAQPTAPHNNAYVETTPTYPMSPVTTARLDRDPPTVTTESSPTSLANLTHSYG